MDQPRKLPPIWLLGLANAPLGLSGGIGLLTIPQVLAARHVPEPMIAQLTTIGLIPSFGVFLLGPLIDVWFPRRTWAAGAVIVSALATMVVVTTTNLTLLGVALLFSMGGGSFNNVAIGGWFGSLIGRENDRKLGAWFVVANVGSFGLISGVGILAIRAFPPPVAAALLAAPLLAPLLIFAITPAPPPDQRLARESFGRFMKDLGHLVRQPLVLQLLLLFAVPAASFALTNTLGGLGRDYGASEQFVALMGGVAVTGAGIVGSLLVPPLAKRMPSRSLYLSIGALGALFTLSLIGLPHTTVIFGAAIIGQNVAQSAALALNNVIALESLGEDNPFAATQFGLITCAAAFPITYMQYLDGHAYGAGGLTRMYLTDGGLGLAACIVMALLLRMWARRPAQSSVA